MRRKPICFSKCWDGKSSSKKCADLSDEITSWTTCATKPMSLELTRELTSKHLEILSMPVCKTEDDSNTRNPLKNIIL